MDYERARKIVKQASELESSASSWLFLDERGIHEKSAAEYLESTAEKAKQLGYSPDEVDRQIALKLVVDALEAMMLGAS